MPFKDKPRKVGIVKGIFQDNGKIHATLKLKKSKCSPEFLDKLLKGQLKMTVFFDDQECTKNGKIEFSE